MRACYEYGMAAHIHHRIYWQYLAHSFYPAVHPVYFQGTEKTPMRKVVEWCERRADQKSEQIRKYAYWGVFLFVAVPLPGTGAWMGALISALLGMDPKKTFPFIMLGVLTAGIIVSVLSFGLLGSLGL